MGVFNNFPYANFHELNADWIIEQVRKVMDEWEEYKTDMDLWKLGVDNQLAEFQTWFDNLDVQDEVRTVINELIQSGEFIEITSPQIVSATEAWLAAHITPTTPAVDDTLSISGAAADAKVTGDRISDLKEDLNVKSDDIVKSYSDISAYLYRTNMYMNDGTPTDLSGYNIYRLPLENLDFVSMTWDKNDPFSGTLGGNTVAVIENLNGTFTKLNANQSNQYYYLHFVNATGTFFGSPTSKALYLNVKADKVSTINFSRDKTVPILSNDCIHPVILTENNTGDFPISHHYLNTSNIFAVIAAPFYSLKMKVKAGDKFLFSGTLTGLSFRGTLRNQDGSVTQITNKMVDYTVPNDGIMMLFGNPNLSYSIEYYPIDSIKVSSKDIIGDVGSNQFQNLNGVAFGTSLTYRAQTTGGYLQYLPDLCGMIFDNQGIGSSTILGGMLTAIKNYANYSDKRVCLFEGFVNDWYGNNALGTYEDTTEDTVCGCVRSALNHMLTQNQNMTIFLILDNYGRNYSNIDCSPSATNGAGLTQFEYYDEIAKVAESMGIATIKLYAFSGMNSYTTQYFIDNIHPNSLGAKQTAYAIWSQMKQYYPNQI